MKTTQNIHYYASIKNTHQRSSRARGRYRVTRRVRPHLRWHLSTPMLRLPCGCIAAVRDRLTPSSRAYVDVPITWSSTRTGFIVYSQQHVFFRLSTTCVRHSKVTLFRPRFSMILWVFLPPPYEYLIAAVYSVVSAFSGRKPSRKNLIQKSVRDKSKTFY